MNIVSSTRKRKFLVTFLLSSLALGGNSAFGQDLGPPAFRASCVTGDSHHYNKFRDSSDEKIFADGWTSKGPDANRTVPVWEVEYRGGQNLIIDGVPYPIVGMREYSIVSTKTYPAGTNINQSSFAINLTVNAAVATHLTNNSPAPDIHRTGIMLRAWNMQCDIEILE